MIARAAICRVAGALLLLVAAERPAAALPTMIRLGYSECSACHISPQGGGPLNAYGRGIDQAQSLAGGEYVPPVDNKVWRTLALGGRTTQDLRLVTQGQETQVSGASTQQRLWPRLMYRNVTALGKGWRVSGIVTGEHDTTLRPSLTYDPASAAASVFVNTALLHYKAGQTLEFAAGRDELPTGINLPDQGLWIKSRNRLGYYDSPTQIKMFWTASRFHLTPFVYGSGGNETPGESERGAGTLAEVVLGPQRIVLGTSLLEATASSGDRKKIGGYARLGFGRWGILAEHDYTERTRVGLGPFPQNASYGQVFWAIREWLVATAGGERLQVAAPFAERMIAGKLELAARLASQASVSFSARQQYDQIAARTSTSVMVQAAFKTVR